MVQAMCEFDTRLVYLGKNEGTTKNIHESRDFTHSR